MVHHGGRSRGSSVGHGRAASGGTVLRCRQTVGQRRLATRGTFRTALRRQSPVTGRAHGSVTSWPRQRSAAKSSRRLSAQRGVHRSSRQDEEDDEDDDEDTDDEDSDDEQRDILEERLREEERLEALPCKLDKRAKQAPHLATTATRVPYQIAIPTYERWRPVMEMTQKKRFRRCTVPFILMHTLGFLSRQKIPKGVVTLFVASRKEVRNYRQALHGSEWQDVNIVVSVLGNKNSRNFIYKYYKEGAYVVSIDDDVERISWKFREGITHHVLGALPPGSLEKLIFDAYRRMKEKKAFLWGVNTSQNPRHMRSYGVSVKNGLVNGYMNGFICRPQCAAELLRTLTDATEDSEFAVKHYAKDGVVLRYRMYAGITSPYLNRGGLQTKFEKRGERITAEQRSIVRKKEERWGAMELHNMFPDLVGEPRPRRDKKTMEVVFHSNGYPPGMGIKRRMIAPRLHDSDRIRYAPNPKIVGSYSHKLYEKYSKARTVAEAKRLGARGIDFAFDSNWGYLTVSKLSLAPRGDNAECCTVQDDFEIQRKRASSIAADSLSATVKVRVLEMSEGHKGLDVPRESLAQLASRCPALRKIKNEETWASMDSPFLKVPLEILRILLRWAATGRLRYKRRHTKAVYNALLNACGNKATARKVKKLEALEGTGWQKSSVKAMKAVRKRKH